jgi:hypothetical protein
VKFAIVVALFLLIVGTGSAKAGVCPSITMKQRSEIVTHYKQLYPHDTVGGYLQITQHDKDAQFIVRIWAWPRLKHTVVVLAKNTCATHI